MTTVTRHRVQCNCGHEGLIVMKENDAPFSSQWESYSLEELDGTSIRGEFVLDWGQVFQRISPKCPECGSHLTTENLKDK